MFERLVWLAPLAVAGAGVWRPRAGLLVLAACLPFFGSPPGGPYLGALEVAGLAAVVCAWRARPGRPSGLDRPVAALVVVALATLLPLAYTPPSWRPGILLPLLASMPGVEAWHGLYTWRVAVGLVLGWALYHAVKRTYAERSPRELGLALGAGLGATLALGLAGHFGFVDLGAYRPAIGVFAPIRRLYSVFFNSGWLAEYLVLATPFAVAAALAGGRRLRRVGWLLGTLAALTLALTRQRGGWAAALVQALFVAAVAAKAGVTALLADRARRRRAALAVAATLVVGLAVVGTVGEGLAPAAAKAARVEKGFSGRPELWQASLELVAERPLAGWGLGAFAGAYDAVRPRGSATARRFRETAHNTYLHVAVEQGLPGVLALALVGWAALSALRRAYAAGGRERRLLVLGLAAAFVGAAIHALVQYLLYIECVGWLLWMLAGAAAALDPGGGRPAVGRAALALAAAALVLVPWRLAAVRAPELAGDRTFGIHEPESHPQGAFRWTAGHAAWRLEPGGDTLVVELANGHPRGGRRPVAVELRLDGATVGELVVAGGWQEHRVRLDPPPAGPVVLEILARPPFRPFSDFRAYPEIGDSWDIRSLGIAVRDIRWEQSLGTGAER